MSSSSTTSDLVRKAVALFQENFHASPTIAVAAPGRVNLIGEHVDYSGGYVFPMAIDRETVMVGKLVEGAGDGSITIATESNVGEDRLAAFNIARLQRGAPKWANYVKGVLANFPLPDALKTTLSFQAAVVTSVPLGAGLSSSAALEVATHTFLEAATNNGVAWADAKLVDKAKACQKAEHDFANVPCGIMDQFISALAKKGHALLINCKDNSFTHIPLTNESIAVLVTDSHVSHSLDGSEYSTRRQQCETALAAIQAKHPSVSCLGDATMAQLDDVRESLDPVVYRRARHAIGECQRTLDASKALAGGDYSLAGKLMVASHESLKNDYEVSCDELDILVKLALECKGVYGARMTGGGFGGCTVTLVDAAEADAVASHIKQGFPQATSFCSRPGPGARIVSL